MPTETVKFKCGHIGTLEFRRGTSSKERERRAAWIGKSSICDDCEKIERDKDYEAAAAEAMAAGLPPLDGSEKQIRWAERLRLNTLKMFDEYLALAQRDAPEIEPKVRQFIANIRDIIDASWWIDQRSYTADQVVRHNRELIEAETTPAPASVEPQSDLYMPEHGASGSLYATLSTTPEYVDVEYPERNSAVVDACKSMGMRWAGNVWRLTMNITRGNHRDRAAEIMAALLKRGIAVKTPHDDVAAAAKDGTWTPTPKRWFTVPEGDSRLWFTCPREDSVFDVARGLPGARSVNGKLLVPASSFAAIEDFCDQYAVAISPGSRQRLDAAREAWNRAMIVSPVAGPQPAPAPQAERGIPDLQPDHDAGIDNDLRDPD